MEEKINEFKQSVHYRDICYLIDHIDNQDVFNSCLEELGYTHGLLLLSDGDPTEPKDVIMGKRGEMRVISYLTQQGIIAECAIYKSAN